MGCAGALTHRAPLLKGGLMSKKIIEGSFLHFIESPALGESDRWEYFADGAMLVEDGRVKICGPRAKVEAQASGEAERFTYSSRYLIMPGFIDVHTHYPQTDMIASWGERLLDWLNRYTFPTEKLFFQAQHAEDVANFFIGEMLRNGTTSASIFPTVHPVSLDAIMHAALKFNMRILAGKVLMDRHGPEDLLDRGDLGYRQTRELIRKWHKKKGTRLLYSLTPRFALTSSESQLQQVGDLLGEFADLHLQTHLSENPEEVELVKRQFSVASYTDVYKNFGLLSNRSIFAHGIHLSDYELEQLAATRSSIAFCPTSNLFLGSGLFPLQRTARDFAIEVGIGTDVGAGTSFSILRTLQAAYYVGQLRHTPLNPWFAFYMATLGGARALNIAEYNGNFLAGKEADLVILDLEATDLISRRLQTKTGLEEQLFALMMLGDDRAVAQTWVMGERVWDREVGYSVPQLAEPHKNGPP